MPSARQQYGTASEDRAARFLQARGYTILDRHVTCRAGEIDLLVEDGETIIAVEVKARRSKSFGSAVESVTQRKLEKLATTLEEIILARGWSDRPRRIDLITIEPNGLTHLIGIDLPS